MIVRKKSVRSIAYGASRSEKPWTFLSINAVSRQGTEPLLQVPLFLLQFLTKISMRKLKSKLKDWGFEKYSKAEEMAFIESKLQSRKAEGKDTTFFVGGRQVTKEALENFMKRKKVDAERIGSPTTSKELHISCKVLSKCSSRYPNEHQLLYRNQRIQRAMKLSKRS